MRRRPYNRRAGAAKPAGCLGHRDIDASRARRPPIRLAGDPRAALRPPSSTPWRRSRDDGAITLPDGVPATVTVERPRQKGHGDYATNVALQLAKQAGHATRASSPSCVADRLERPTASPTVEVAGPGLPQHQRRGRRAGRGRRRDRRGRGGVRRLRRVAGRRSTSSSSPPTRPARCTSAAPAGPPWATRSAGLLEASGAEVTREYYFNDHGAQIDRFSRSLLASGRGRADARRTATPAQYIAEIAEAVVADRPEAPRPARRRGPRGLPRDGVDADVRRDQADAARLRRRLRRLLPRERPARVAARSTEAIDAAHASWATSTRRTARSGCAPRSTATTRTA